MIKKLITTRTKKTKQKSSPVRDSQKIYASYRDPSGFVFTEKGVFYRQINPIYQTHYDFLMKNLYKDLVAKKLLISHQEMPLSKFKQSVNAYKIIKPIQLPFITYPYEWTFSMLKAAALATLKIQKLALEQGMTLKDASSFNIQFWQGQPILIDSLSFEIYEEGKPWVAYKQFVEHFLTPLLLMKYNDIRLNQTSSIFLDGIPVDLTIKLLPWKTRLSPSLLLHIYAHAASQKKHSLTKIDKETVSKSFSKKAFLGLIDNLESTIKKLNWDAPKTQWGDYYDPENNNYNNETFSKKSKIIKEFLAKAKPKTVWDMGANTGFFSRLSPKDAFVISSDNDYGALEKNYQQMVEKKEINILPVFLDLVNPTPSVGWQNQERPGILERGQADIIMALALIHHLAISHNIPLEYVASVFSKLGKYLIIEFVPKEDSQVQILLNNREDIFTNYHKTGFEDAFKLFYNLRKEVAIPKSKRILYFMERR